MSRFPQVVDPAGNPVLTALYEEIVAAGLGDGSPMNWFTSQAARPDIMEASFRFCSGILLQGALPATVKQLIVVLISAINGCDYCRTTHRRALHALEVPAEVIDSVTEGLDLSKIPIQQRAVLELARKAAMAPRSVTDADLEGLRDFGFSDGELIEIVMTAALTNFINTWSRASRIEIDAEAAT